MHTRRAAPRRDAPRRKVECDVMLGDEGEAGYAEWDDQLLDGYPDDDAAADPSLHGRWPAEWAEVQGSRCGADG
eukprot:gene2790-7154_t